MQTRRCHSLTTRATASLLFCLAAQACSSETSGNGNNNTGSSQENSANTGLDGKPVSADASRDPGEAPLPPSRDPGEQSADATVTGGDTTPGPVGESDAGAGSDDPTLPAGKLCGTRGAASCGGKQFCDYKANTMCGAADQGGVCKAKPEACIQVYQPVCGCDGKTYGNGCSANSAGVSVKSTGACEDEPTDPTPTDPVAGKMCGGFAGIACAATQFCNYEKGDGCDGIADGAGKCDTTPKACTKQYQPVCGCDRHSYGNACEAHSKGVSVLRAELCSDVDCKAIGGEVVFGTGPAAKCGKGTVSAGAVKLKSSAQPIEGAICCISAP